MCYHYRSEWTWERWQWKGIPYSPKLQYYWSLTIRLFSVISTTLAEGCFTPLQRCNRCILQPQPTGLATAKSNSLSFLSLSLSLFPSLYGPATTTRSAHECVHLQACWESSRSNKPRFVPCTVSYFDLSLHPTTSILLRTLNSYQKSPQLHDRNFLDNVLLVFHLVSVFIQLSLLDNKYVVNSLWILFHCLAWGNIKP